MSEIRTPVTAVEVDWLCEKEDCGQPMRPTGTVLTSNPPQYVHACSNGHRVQYGVTRMYPYLEWKKDEQSPAGATDQG